MPLDLSESEDDEGEEEENEEEGTDMESDLEGRNEDGKLTFLCVCVCAFNFEPVSLCLHCLLQSSLMKWPGAERKKCSTIQIM